MTTRQAVRDIHGIPCLLKHAATRRIVRDVLVRIRSRSPDDYFALTDRIVELIAPLSEFEVRRGTWGLWATPADDGTHPYGEPVPGTMYLLDDAEPHPHAIATAAHELGHARAGARDLEARGELLSEEWREELAADAIADRWGFGPELAASRPDLDLAHHGVGPGEFFEEALPDGSVGFFTVDAGYRCRCTATYAPPPDWKRTSVVLRGKRCVRIPGWCGADQQRQRC